MKRYRKISLRLFIIIAFIVNIFAICLLTPERSGMVFGVSIIFLLAYEYVEIMPSLMDW